MDAGMLFYFSSLKIEMQMVAKKTNSANPYFVSLASTLSYGTLYWVQAQTPLRPNHKLLKLFISNNHDYSPVSMKNEFVMNAE